MPTDKHGGRGIVGKKLVFCNHHRKDWFRLESSMDAKSSM